MKRQISGTRDGVAWPAPGEAVDLPKVEAQQLVDQDLAHLPEVLPEVETAEVLPEVETAEVGTAPARKTKA